MKRVNDDQSSQYRNYMTIAPNDVAAKTQFLRDYMALNAKGQTALMQNQTQHSIQAMTNDLTQLAEFYAKRDNSGDEHKSNDCRSRIATLEQEQAKIAMGFRESKIHNYLGLPHQGQGLRGAQGDFISNYMLLNDADKRRVLQAQTKFSLTDMQSHITTLATGYTNRGRPGDIEKSKKLLALLPLLQEAQVQADVNFEGWRRVEFTKSGLAQPGSTSTAGTVNHDATNDFDKYKGLKFSDIAQHGSKEQEKFLQAFSKQGNNKSREDFLLRQDSSDLTKMSSKMSQMSAQSGLDSTEKKALHKSMVAVNRATSRLPIEEIKRVQQEIAAQDVVPKKGG